MKHTFPILSFEDGNSESLDNGTGFFVNTDGVFLSAGHVFKDEKRTYFAIIDGERKPIKIIYKEYQEQESQSPPTYFDLVVGLVYNVSLNNHDTIIFSNEVKIDDKCELFGYSKQELRKRQSVIIHTSEEAQENRIPKLRTLIATCNRLAAWRRNEKNDIVWYTNCISMNMNDILAFGLSGGPFILDQNNVVGMLITADTCLSSQYLMSILDKNNIKYSFK